MKRGRAFVMFLFAAAMAVGAGAIANKWVEERTSVQASTRDVEPVVVTTVDIPFGHSVGPGDVKVAYLPEGFAPSGTFGDTESVIGRVATQKMLAGETVLKGKVVEHGAGSALAAVIDPGKRAITVRVNDVIGVAGFLLPGNRVDVLATRRKDGRKVESFTLLENIKVLAVDQTASPEKDEPVIVRAVTLEASPGDSEALVKATQEGAVQLVLRNPTTPTMAKKPPKPKPKKVVSKPKPKPRKPVQRKPEPPPPSFVTVIKGTDVSRVRIKD